MYCDFMGRAGDEIFNQLAKWQAMSGGLLRMPVVLRVSVGSKYGAQHSQDWCSMCAHIPGLKVVFPATPYDAKGLMYSALLGTDPVIFFESQRIYDQPELFHPGGVPIEAYEIPIGEPDVKKAGNDLTILSIGATLYRALDAAQELEAKHGVSCEVIDARSIVPFNFEKLIASVKKTRKILLVSDACERGSALQTFATKITQFAFDELDGPPVVVGARNWITPADEIEDAFFPQTSSTPSTSTSFHSMATRRPASAQRPSLCVEAPPEFDRHIDTFAVDVGFARVQPSIRAHCRRLKTLLS
jgi:2-oxoisovalerate dehydrogenase E1 component